MEVCSAEFTSCMEDRVLLIELLMFVRVSDRDS